MNSPTHTLERNRQYLRALIGLLLISSTATLAVSWMEKNTRSIIAANEQAHELEILTALLPAGSYDNHPERDVIMVIDRELLGSESAQPVYSARANGQVVTSVLTVTAPAGYAGPIQLLVGITRDGNITGVRAIRHRETPGLGDRIDTNKSSWIETFARTELNAAESGVALRQDGGTIDHITGATITSRAVTNAVANALQFHANNRTVLLAQLDTTEYPAPP